MYRLFRFRWAAGVALAAVVIAGCGSSSSSSTSTSTTTGTASSAGKNGGAVTVLEAAGGVDSLDPGYWYYQTDYTDLFQPTQRALYGFRPQDTTPQPDLATAQPVLTDGGKTLTIHIRPGVHYSAPLASRTVAAADIKYAMERCFAANVGNGYAFTYFTNIVGAPSKPSTSVSDISGIQAPNASTLVIKTKVPVGVLTVPNALALPCTVPIPQDYAAKYDKGAQSTYGMHQVFTGPYMIQGAGAGRSRARVIRPGSSWCWCVIRAGCARPIRSGRPTSTRSRSRAVTTSRSPASRSWPARA